MDNKTKGMVMTAMVVLSLVLGILAVLGSSWMTASEDGMEANYSLSEVEVEATEEGIGMTFEMDYGEACEDSEDDEPCELATAGTIGTIGLWVGIVMAGLFAVMMILPMAGIDAMDGIPDIAQKLISWGAGGMMLLGAIAWLIMKPDLEDDTIGLGMSFFMAIIAGVLGLAASAMGMLVKADE
jgi:hypothetical protein